MISIALVFAFLYTNLFTIGYTFLDYLGYIFKKPEFLQIFLGIILVAYSFRKGKCDEKHF